MFYQLVSESPKEETSRDYALSLDVGHAYWFVSHSDRVCVDGVGCVPEACFSSCINSLDLIRVRDLRVSDSDTTEK